MASDTKTQMSVLVNKLELRGFRVTKRNGHFNVKKPDGTRLVTIPSTPSDHRSVDNAYADLRRHGVDVRKHDGKKKGSIDDFALARLRERVMKQRQRVTRAQLARLAFYVAARKKLPPFGSIKAGELILRRIENSEGRITKSNHNLLAATLNLVESADDQALAGHIAAADELQGLQRHRTIKQPEASPEPPVRQETPPAATEPEPTQEESEPTEVRHIIEFRLPAAERAFIRELLLAVVEARNGG